MTEPTKKSIGFRVLDKSKFLTKQGFKLGLRRNFAGTYTGQAWECVKGYPLENEYKGGFEETGNIERKRNKSKEIDKGSISAKNGYKKVASDSIRTYISNKVFEKMKDKCNKQKELELDYNEEGSEKDDEIIPQNETFYSWFHNHPTKEIKPMADNVRNVKTANVNGRMKIYKKSLEANTIKKSRRTTKEHFTNAQWKNEINESIRKAEQRLKLERSIRTPATNFTRPKYEL